MWHLIDKEMVLKECSIYCYAPEEDPYDGEEGALWSSNYFFFNKAKKRVCYLYLRGLSMLEFDSGLKTLVTPGTPGAHRSKRCVSGTWSLDDEETTSKRARFWLGDRADGAQLVDVDDDERTPTMTTTTANRRNLPKDNGDEPTDEGDGEEESRFMAFSSTDEGGGPESPCQGRDRSASFTDAVHSLQGD